MGQRPAAALRLATAALLLPLVLAACTGPAEPSSARGPSRPGSGSSGPISGPTAGPIWGPISGPTSGPTSTGPRLDRWTVGAHPLPLRPDGFGEVLATPRVLRVRRLATVDLLAPPTDGRFHSTISRVTPAVRTTMGQSWSPRCPVGLDDLRVLTMSFHGFDGRDHTGRMIVNERVATAVVGVFATLFRARFPIEEMRPVATADLTAPPTGDGNDTAAFVCRATRRQTTWSAHAYGLAIDLDPFMNPYHSGDLVLPELASSYLDRGWHRPGMVLPGGVATRAFAAAGWTWGGDFRTVSDLMHFSANGR